MGAKVLRTLEKFRIETQVGLIARAFFGMCIFEAFIAMIKHYLLPALMILWVGCSNHSEETDEKSFSRDMVEIMSNMKTYTMDTYHAAPNSAMSFRPTPEVMSFEEQAAHISTNLYVQYHSLIKSGERVSTDQALTEAGRLIAGKTGDDLALVMSEQFDLIIARLQELENQKDWNSIQTLKQFDSEPEKDMMTIIMMIRDHITHHRAQMIVYLRLMGQVPPDYVPF